jgi:hypothetical protein
MGEDDNPSVDSPEILAILKRAKSYKLGGDVLSGLGYDKSKVDGLPDRDPITGEVPGIPQAGIYNPKTGKVEGESSPVSNPPAELKLPKLSR